MKIPRLFVVTLITHLRRQTNVSGFLRYKSTKVHIIMVRYAGIEAGGTTWVVAIAEGNPLNVVSYYLGSGTKFLPIC